jgi:glucose/mannose-6-phosphate isomerase
MNDLDDPRTYAAFDPSGMRGRLRDGPRQCANAWRQVQAANLPDLPSITDHVVICGMGGSAIAGDLALDLSAATGGAPVTVVRDFRLPFTPTERTLVVVCSYSGNTKETLSMYNQAVSSLASVVAITAGGELARLSKERNIPTLRITAHGEPRSAVGYNLILLLGLLGRLCQPSFTGEEMTAAVDAMRRQVDCIGPNVPTKENQAKQLAAAINGKLPIIYGGDFFHGMARRWKSQLNENAKVWAFCDSIPELLHNSVEPFPGPRSSGQELMALVLQPAAEAGPLAHSYSVVAEMLQRHDIPHRVLTGSGSGPLAQVLSMLAVGDYVSYYLALLRGIDPSPTPSIEEAKGLFGEVPRS